MTRVAVYRGDPNRMSWPLRGKPSRAKPLKVMYRCVGGPMDGERIALSDGTTAIFSLWGKCGHYKSIIRDPKLPRIALWNPA